MSMRHFNRFLVPTLCVGTLLGTLRVPSSRAIGAPISDRYGDPLPAGARARLGTVHFRHGWSINALAFSPDGKRIAAVGYGRALTLWDVATGKETCRFPNRGQPLSVAFSPNGKILASMDYRSCYLFDSATGKELRRLRENISPRHVAFSPDGKTVAAGCRDILIAWDAATGKEMFRLSGKIRELEEIAFSPDGRWIASAGEGGTIRLWNAHTGQAVRQWPGHKNTINALAFSPNDNQLATAGKDETLRLWDASTGRQVRLLGERLRGVVAATFSPDGKRLATGHQDGTIRLWDVEAGREVRRWRAHSSRVFALAFSPDGRTLASGGFRESVLRFWDAATGEERHAKAGHRGSIQGLHFSDDGRRLRSSASDRQILWWDLKNNEVRRRFSWLSGGAGRFALSADGRTIVSCSDITKELFASEVGSTKPGRLLGTPPNPLMSLGIAPNGRWAATGGLESKIRLWDLSAGKEMKPIEEVTNGVLHLVFSPDGKRLAGGLVSLGRGAKPALRLWDVSDGKELCRFHCGESRCSPVAFSPDGKVLATGHVYINPKREYIAYVRLWDTTTGEPLCRHEGGLEPVGSIAFSPDGKLIAFGYGGWPGESGCAFDLWEAATGKRIRRFSAHHSGVTSLVFSPDGLTLASGGGDSTILLWDLIDRSRKSIPPPREKEAYWKALGDADAAKAYDAVWAFVAAPEQALPFLQSHLRPVPRPDAKIIARLLKDLEGEEFAVRRKAAEELGKYGDAIVADLRKALEGTPSLEVRRRVQQLLRQSREWTAARLRDHRAIQVLEHIKARGLLEALASGPIDAQRTEDAKAALRRLLGDASPKR